MPWSLLVLFLVGAVCAVRLPILHFTLVVVIVIAGYALASIGSAKSGIEVFVWSALYAGALEGGYILANCLFYLVFVKFFARKYKRPPSNLNSKYSQD
ncbi:hypothetical protein A6U87_11465 [Rhizobium sp. AC44/96]|nr:hypothetical protein A6U87_11465 [Rhizobium sp. AC44/96]